MQRGDFAGIFRVMGGRPVTIRTLDPPLHEFLPHDAERPARGRRRSSASRPRPWPPTVDDLHETNPMLGHRGCRLGIIYPEITEMQARAILEAACDGQEGGRRRPPRDHDPAGRHQEGARRTRPTRARAWPPRSSPSAASTVEYLVGTMIEIPRAALTADKIAEVGRVLHLRHQRPHADDLRRVAATTPASSCRRTCKEEIWPADPFATLDQEGVGELVEIGVEKGRSTRAGPEGRHLRRARRRPETVKFCHRVGLDYVSCSPFRVPVARLAAAQAAIEERGELELEK